MQKTVGILMIITGVIAGIYAGLWWAFIGGIVDIIQAIRAPELLEMDVAIGVAKIMFAGLIGWVVSLFFLLPGYTLLEKD